VSRFARTTWPAACLLANLLAGLVVPGPVAAFPADLFGYGEAPQADIAAFPQWAQALERQLRDRLRDTACTGTSRRGCELRDWQAFLQSVRALPRAEQLRRVNRYANDHPYILDGENYGREDYWAIPREFLPRGGDCEDFVLAKYFSLRLLGYGVDELRVVVVQDTNLRVPHAVLAVARGSEAWILDNQVQQVRSHRDIVHYAPVYSINDRQWWLHAPR
jgi:predicted transglutaminase-like cysteine proteinase